MMLQTLTEVAEIAVAVAIGTIMAQVALAVFLTFKARGEHREAEAAQADYLARMQAYERQVTESQQAQADLFDDGVTAVGSDGRA
jgi:Tfp pilus assembly protein PilE